MSLPSPPTRRPRCSPANSRTTPIDINMHRSQVKFTNPFKKSQISKQECRVGRSAARYSSRPVHTLPLLRCRLWLPTPATKLLLFRAYEYLEVQKCSLREGALGKRGPKIIRCKGQWHWSVLLFGPLKGKGYLRKCYSRTKQIAWGAHSILNHVTLLD